MKYVLTFFLVIVESPLLLLFYLLNKLCCLAKLLFSGCEFVFSAFYLILIMSLVWCYGGKKEVLSALEKMKKMKEKKNED